MRFRPLVKDRELSLLVMMKPRLKSVDEMSCVVTLPFVTQFGRLESECVKDLEVSVASG